MTSHAVTWKVKRTAPPRLEVSAPGAVGSSADSVPVAGRSIVAVLMRVCSVRRCR